MTPDIGTADKERILGKGATMLHYFENCLYCYLSYYRKYPVTFIVYITCIQNEENVNLAPWNFITQLTAIKIDM
jgi:hypothetical protein